MIIWLASYPRSGNTFLRILMKHLYDQPTYTGFASNDDLETDADRGDLTGHTRLPARVLAARDNPAELRAALDELDRSPQLYFIKSHQLSAPEFDHGHRAILLVRDARDALCSHVWYLADVMLTFPRLWADARSMPRSLRSLIPLALRTRTTLLVRAAKRLRSKSGFFRYLMQALIGRTRGGAGPHRWRLMNRSWLERPSGTTVVLRYEDLVADPIGSLSASLKQLGISLQPTGERFPSFEELKQVHGRFFRKGAIGGWREELPPDLEHALWAIVGDEMQAQGYAR